MLLNIHPHNGNMTWDRFGKWPTLAFEMGLLCVWMNVDKIDFEVMYVIYVWVFLL